jgi:hypothetical protein
MKGPPSSVIHINFIAGPLIFDARPVWSAAREAENKGRIPKQLATRLYTNLGDTAIHLGTRHYVMKRAIDELKASLRDIYNLVPDPWSIPNKAGFRVVSGKECEHARDRVLLAIDSFLFEFRAFLDLLARFVYGFLVEIGKAPAASQLLSSGRTVDLIDKRHKLRPHAFLLYMADKLGVPISWYEFLNAHRNFFTHEGAPYCAIEDRMVRPPEFDLIVMKTNIHDFHKADPADYFRISECQSVVEGLRSLSASVQQHLIETVLK